MKITWIGHSCFKVEKDGFAVVLDPYETGSVPGLAPVQEEASLVLCSHEHHDHNARREVKITHTVRSPFSVEMIETFHDDVKGEKRGSNKIHILSDGNVRIAHLGDLGCTLTPLQTAKLKKLDVMLVPVGGFYTINARQAAQLIRETAPKTVIPMHFRDDAAGFGFDAISEVGDFLRETGHGIRSGESVLDLEDPVQEQIVVLEPLRRK